MSVVPVVQPRFDFDCVKGMDCGSMIRTQSAIGQLAMYIRNI